MAQKISERVKSKFDSIDQEKLLSTIALLPLFFSWLFVYSKNSISESCRKSCLLGATFFLYFIFLLILSFIFSFIPVYGALIGNIIHTLSVLVYLGLSGIFIYAFNKGKSIEIKFVEKSFLKLTEILQ